MVVGILPILTEYIIRRVPHKQLEWLMVCRVMVVTDIGDIRDSAAIDDIDAVLTIEEGITNGS
jgi:hypothetical protein